MKHPLLAFLVTGLAFAVACGQSDDPATTPSDALADSGRSGSNGGTSTASGGADAASNGSSSGQTRSDAATPVDDAGDGVLVPQVVASRISGPAPLAVHFDAIATTHADPSKDTFREVEYAFDYGDPDSGSYASGASKNSQVSGPMGAHVYDVPGTYTASVTVKEGVSHATKTVTITVESADAHWPAAKTIVVSPSADFAGAPAGAEQRTSLPASYDGKRILLHRGESFGSISIESSADDVQVGAYGAAGAKPRVAGVSLRSSNEGADFPDEITLMDLKVLSGAFSLDGSGSRILLYRSEIDTPSQGEAQIDIGTASTYFFDHNSTPGGLFYWPREIFLVENTVLGNVDDDGHPGIVCMGYFARSALLGNTMNKATQHTLRMWNANRVLIAHNSFGGEHYAPNPPGIRHAIKIHSGGVAPYDDNMATSGTQISTRFLVIANNTIGSAAYQGSWLVGLGPENIDPGTVQPVIDVLVENNGFVRGPHTSQDVHMLAQRGTTRGNFVVAGGEFNGDVVRVSESEADPAMDAFTGPYFGQLTE